jgi:hypothetical protein
MAECLLAPTVCPKQQIEFSVHKITSKSLREELGRVFPDLKQALGGSPGVELLVVATCQQASSHLLDFTLDADADKERLLGRFFNWSKLLANHLKRRGHWADFSDPASGYPVLGARSNFTSNDVDLIQRLLKYPCSSVGGCSILAHPRYLTSAYPACFFTTAPFPAVKEGLDALGGAPLVPHSCSGGCAGGCH